MSNYAAVMPEVGHIEIEDVGEPMPGPRDAIVRIEAVGVCGSDTAYYTMGYIGDYVVNGPIVLGHECAGEVVAVGPDVTRVRPGDRVAIEPGKPCRDCRECMAGRYHLCPDLVFLATPPYDGSLVERMAIDERQLFPIPSGCPTRKARSASPVGRDLGMPPGSPRARRSRTRHGRRPCRTARRAGRSGLRCGLGHGRGHRPLPSRDGSQPRFRDRGGRRGDEP